MLRIKEFRTLQGLTQAELASKAGISRSYINLLESGKKPINSVRLQQVAKALGVTESALLEQDDEKTSALAQLVSLVRRADQQDLLLLLELARGMVRRRELEQDAEDPAGGRR